MFCHKCGAAAISDARFCARCGAELSAAPVGTNPIEMVAPVTAPPDSDPELDSTRVPTPAQPSPRPWVRMWSRMFDIYLFTIIAMIALMVIAPQWLQGQNDYVLGIALTFVWVFVEAFMLSSLQTTPGKWLFKTRLVTASGEPIDHKQALVRSFKVWWRGLGVGLPMVSLFTMAVAHGRLTSNGITSWDKDGGFRVTHEKIGLPRTLVAVMFFFMFLLLVVVGTTPDQS